MFINGLPLFKRSSKYNRRMLSLIEHFDFLKSHQTSSRYSMYLFPHWKRWARKVNKDSKYPMCRLNSRPFSHRINYNTMRTWLWLTTTTKNLSSPLLLLKPVVFVPAITCLASSGEREKVCLEFTRKVLSLSFPHQFLGDFFTWGRGRWKGGECYLAGVRSTLIFYTHTEADWRGPEHIFEELCTLIRGVRGYAEAVSFPSLLWKTPVSGKEHLAPAICRVRAGLWHTTGEGACTKTQYADVSLLPHWPHVREGAAWANRWRSLSVRHGTRALYLEHLM